MIKEYHKPATIEEAVSIKGRFGEQASYLGCGTRVNSNSFPRSPEHVISLDRLALAEIQSADAGLRIGACCTLQQLIDAADVPECLKTAAGHTVNRNIRNMASIGGELAANDRCSSLIAILFVLEATVDVASGGSTFNVDVRQYVTDGRDDLITHVIIPKSSTPRSTAIEKYSMTANDPAVVTAAVSLGRAEDAVADPIVAVGGVADRVIRLLPVEQELHGQPLPTREVIERSVSDQVFPSADIRGSIEFKKHLAGVLVAKAVVKAYRPERQ